jgi:uncharacterized membrane protein
MYANIFVSIITIAQELILFHTGFHSFSGNKAKVWVILVAVFIAIFLIIVVVVVCLVIRCRLHSLPEPHDDMEFEMSPL